MIQSQTQKNSNQQQTDRSTTDERTVRSTARINRLRADADNPVRLGKILQTSLSSAEHRTKNGANQHRSARNKSSGRYGDTGNRNHVAAAGGRDPSHR